MLTVADLEVNVFDFRGRSFQFDRLLELAGGPYAVFSRTETESERQLRPRLVRLVVVVPLGWVALDAVTDELRVAKDGPARPSADAPPVEVAAEPPVFEEAGVRWKRVPTRGATGYVYAPLELEKSLLHEAGLKALGLG